MPAADPPHAALFAGSPDAILLIDAAFADAAIGMSLVAPDGRFLRVNRALCALTGYDEDDLLGRSFQEVTHPDDLAADLTQHRRMLAGEIPGFRMEKRYLRKDGRTVWVDLAVSLVRDRAGGPLHVLGQVQDVTERKRAEAELRASEARYRTLVERLPLLVYEQPVGPVRRPRYVSPQVAAIYGYTPEEWDASRPHRMHPDDRDRVAAEMAHTDETGEPFRIEYRERTKDGRWVWVRDEAVLIRDAEGAPDYWLGVKLDVGDRKQAEADVRRSEARLRSLVANATEIVTILDRDGTVRY